MESSFCNARGIIDILPRDSGFINRKIFQNVPTSPILIPGKKQKSLEITGISGDFCLVRPMRFERTTFRVGV